MTPQGYQVGGYNSLLSAKTCEPRHLPHYLLYQHIIRVSSRSFLAMKYIPMWTNFHFFVRVLAILFFLQQRPTSVDMTSTASSFWPLRMVLSAMFSFQSGRVNSRSLIVVMQWSIRRSRFSQPAHRLFLMFMDWANTQTCSLTILSFHCVVKPPFSCQIAMVSTAHCLTPTLVLSAERWTCCVGIWIVFAYASTDFGNQKASQYIVSSQQWSMIEWWISNARYTTQASGVLNIWSMVKRCGSSGE